METSQALICPIETSKSYVKEHGKENTITINENTLKNKSNNKCSIRNDSKIFKVFSRETDHFFKKKKTCR